MLTATRQQPPSTPVHPALRRMANPSSSPVPSPITDSPLPPAPVSAFIIDDDDPKFEHDSDQDSPGVGRRAPPPQHRLDDLGIPRLTKSSPVISSEEQMQDLYEIKSSPANQPSRAATRQYRSTYMRGESSAATSRPAYMVSTSHATSQARSRVPSRNEATPPPPRGLEEDSEELPPAPVPSSLLGADSNVRSSSRNELNEGAARRSRGSNERRYSDEAPAQDDAHRSPPRTSIRPDSGYRTPAMGGRAFGSSSLAASTNCAARSAGRSLRKLTRSTQSHVPARRVQRYQDEEEDELDDSQGSEERPQENAPKPYDYDPARAEMLERASLVRSPTPPSAQAEEEEREEESPPPPVLEKQRPRPAAQGRAAAMNDILAAKVPALSVNGARRVLPASGAEAMMAIRQPPPKPPSSTEMPGMINENDPRWYNDFRPALIWEEAARQLRQPPANHEELMSKAVQMMSKVDKDRDSQKVIKTMHGLKYGRLSKIGKGGFATVYAIRGPLYEPLPHDPTQLVEVPEDGQAFFALKQVDLSRIPTEKERQDLISEAHRLSLLADLEGSEKHLLRYFGHRVVPKKQLRILMELGDKAFNEVLRIRLSSKMIAHYWRQMLEAVLFIHDAGVIHADLKPANFLLVRDRVKLIDFGISGQVADGTVNISRDSLIGTPNYMAPEAIGAMRNKDHKEVYKAGKPSDVWALGCILYQMIYGSPPFDHVENQGKKLDEITDRNHRISYPSYRQVDVESHQKERVDPIMLDCLQSTLLYNAQERATIPQLLHHPFLLDTVTISRQKLRDLVARLRLLALKQELTEDNVIERADLLFDNLRASQ